jgi:UDP-glucose 4-epimerase
MNVLITGGAGFIGSHLAEHLYKKNKIKKIYILDNFKDGALKNLKNIINKSKIKILKCDLLNKKKFFKIFPKNIEAVFHLAALSDVVPSIENPSLYLKNNFLGTLNLLEIMKKRKINKIIYSASSSCYGVSSKTPTNEKAKIETTYPYAFSKYVSEELIIHWSSIYRLKYVSLRLFNVYGPRSRTHGAYGAALGVFLKQKLSNKPYTIVGDGSQKRDFIYVTDVAEAFYKSLNKKIKNQIFNISSGKPISINYLIRLLGGKKIFLPNRPGEPRVTHGKIIKAKKLLGWEPRINFNNGIDKVLKNINYWKNAPLWTKSKIDIATKTWFKYMSKYEK